MQQTRNAVDVLVVGAGPTGLVMAAELARRGVACRIIDKLPTATQTSKALAVQSRTLELFDIMGVVDEALECGVRVGAVNLYANEKRLVHLPFDELNGPYPFMLDLAQSETERILGAHLASLGVQIERQVELLNLTQDEREGVTAIVRHADGREEDIHAAWLVGCDGAHSAVRHLLNMPFSGSAYPEDFALADVRVTWSLPDDEAHLSLNENGILAAFPLANGRYRLIIETSEHASDGKPPEPTLEDIQRYLTERSPVAATVSDPHWISGFRINARKVEHYRQGHVFLAGDAAHIHSPAGGQGMNTGIQDAFNLAWKLALVNAGQAPEALLDSYEAERHPVAESVLQMSDVMLRVAMLRQPIAQHMRNRLVSIVSQLEIVQHRFAEQIAELGIHYRKSLIVAEYGFANGVFAHSGPKAGDRAIEAHPLIRADNTATHLMELLRGTKHTLFVLSGEQPSASTLQRLNALANETLERHGNGIQVYLVIASETMPEGMSTNVPVLLDGKRSMHAHYGAATDCLYLVRPDGYIGYRSMPVDADHFWEYTGRMFLSRSVGR